MSGNGTSHEPALASEAAPRDPVAPSPRDKLRAAYRRQTELVRDLLKHTKEVGRLEAELGLEPAAARKLVEEATAGLGNQD